MAEAGPADRSEEVSQPVSIYTGPKVIAEVTDREGRFVDQVPEE